MEVTQVDIIPMPTSDLGEKAIRWCAFCQKEIETKPSNDLLHKLSGPDNFFCSFCLRHRFNSRDARHILVLSFRGVIGHFYNEFYLHQRKMALCEIEDYLDKHEEIGLLNPVFSYDPETMLWFIDFRRIGNSKKKLPIEDVLATIENILNCFDIPKLMPGVKSHLFFNKYKDAIHTFYIKRYRPEGKRLLIPTLVNCGHLDCGKTLEKAKFFTRKQMNF